MRNLLLKIYHLFVLKKPGVTEAMAYDYELKTADKHSDTGILYFDDNTESAYYDYHRMDKDRWLAVDPFGYDSKYITAKESLLGYFDYEYLEECYQKCSAAL